jgi:hypothetical protein
VLGALPGVVSTRAGWLRKEEVVEVEFDPRVTSYAELLAKSRAVEKPSTVFTYDAADQEVAKARLGDQAVQTKESAKDAKAADRRYYLRRSPLWLVPMTDVQAVRTNALLAAKKDPGRVLSPRQLKWVPRLTEAWALAEVRAELAKLSPARQAAAFTAYEERLDGALRKPR